MLLDLIEPYWNVKVILFNKAAELVGRFNRTILECKGKLRLFTATIIRRFNRTILECKVVTVVVCGAAVLGFNRTILECKVCISHRTKKRIIDLIEPYWNVKT